MSTTRKPTQLLLVRHGQTSWNAAGRWQGHADPGLSALGREQARALAEALAAARSRDPIPRWSGIVASDLRRARETASAIATLLELPIETDRRLRELDVGAWSGLTRSEIERLDPEALQRFEAGDIFARPGGGESRHELRRRALDFATDLARQRPGEAWIVVTHRGIVRSLAPGTDPSNADRILVVAEEVVARGLDSTGVADESAL